MRKMMKTGMVFFMAMLVLMTQHVTADAKAKVLNKKMTIDLNKDSAGIRFCTDKAKEVFQSESQCEKQKGVEGEGKWKKVYLLERQSRRKNHYDDPII